MYNNTPSFDKKFLNIKKLAKRQNIIFLLSIIILLFGIIKLGATTIRTSHLPLQVRKDLQIIIYAKEGCRFCIMAEELLRENNIAYEIIDLSFNMALQQKLIKQTGQTTVPYIFINNKFIGGYKNLLKIKNEDKL